jgi:hypothetical protein
MPRKASLTASSVGNAAATSGSISTTLVPLRYCPWCLPRTPPFIEAKSYSGRMSPLLRCSMLFFFIESSLTWSCRSCADDPDCLLTFGVGYDEPPAHCRCANREKSLLVGRMFGIGKSCREWITEHGCSLSKADYVFPLIREIFPRIPFELHPFQYKHLGTMECTSRRRSSPGSARAQARATLEPRIRWHLGRRPSKAVLSSRSMVFRLRTKN